MMMVVNEEVNMWGLEEQTQSLTTRLHLLQTFCIKPTSKSSKNQKKRFIKVFTSHENGGRKQSKNRGRTNH